MKTDTGDTATIFDFDAQTITTVNNRQKTVAVRKFSDIVAAASDVNAKIDVKKTGQKKVINGYNAGELILTIQMDSPAAAQIGKMQIEMDMWLSSDPPGVNELRALYQKNRSRFPFAAMAEMQRKIAEDERRDRDERGEDEGRHGAPAGAGWTGAAQAQQAMARIQAMQGGAVAGSGSLMEMTMESTDFSTSSIPDSVCAIPAGYQKVDQK